MKRFALIAAIAAVLLAPTLVWGQAADLPSAAPARPAGETDTDRGQTLIKEMIKALGGDAWLNRTTIQSEGRGSAFFHGEPNPYITEFHELVRLPGTGEAGTGQSGTELPWADRVGFLTDKSMIFPGKKIDVVQIWKEGHGYEVTFKGQTELPKDQVDDYYRRREHSIEQVVGTWIHAPGVMIVSEGSGMVERHLVDKVTVLTANNDAVTLDLDSSTHLPIQRTFRWRNPQFNDYDEEGETYDDYHTIQGLPTPLTITRYHNGEMTNQRYLTKVVYGVPADASLFDPSVLIPKLKK